MGAPTETYIDPSIAGDSGAGTIGDPYGDVQYALDQVTRDATDGDRFNVKAGTDEILAAALDFSTYGTPTQAAPWICQGYTSAAGDGGEGGISGAGSYSVITGDTLDYLAFVDMHLHNSGANDVISADNGMLFVNCEINNTSANGLDIDNDGAVLNCYIHDIGGYGIYCVTACFVKGCTFKEGTNTFDYAIRTGSTGTITNNVLDLGNPTVGIWLVGQGCYAANNSIRASAGTGDGILLNSGAERAVIFNNIVEGFSGVGGGAITLESVVAVYGHNAFYNNTANLTDNSELILSDLTANDLNLSASPFIDAATDDFRVKPNVQALGFMSGNFPGLSVRGYYDIGALQRKYQMIVHPGMSGGARG